MMKRSLCLLLALCLLAAALSGCAGELPAPPPQPAAETTPQSETPSEPEIAATPAPAELPDALELRFALPAADSRGEELRWYFSPAEEFDCGFVYPSYCSVWVEKGAIRLNPSWFFARMFFTGVLRNSDTAPEALLDLLETGKWGTHPQELTAGSGWTALRAMHLKYDTWRDWVAWETPERFYLLYGSCFDGREEVLDLIFTIIAESFRTGGEMLLSSPGTGALLRRSDALDLFFEGASLGGGSSAYLELRLRAASREGGSGTLTVPACAADGQSLSCEERIEVLPGEEQLWTLHLPLLDEESRIPFESLAFRIGAEGDASFFELPVEIEINR